MGIDTGSDFKFDSDTGSLSATAPESDTPDDLSEDDCIDCTGLTLTESVRLDCCYTDQANDDADAPASDDLTAIYDADSPAIDDVAAISEADAPAIDDVAAVSDAAPPLIDDVAAASDADPAVSDGVTRAGTSFTCVGIRSCRCSWACCTIPTLCR
jgi:hypothetical protein